MNSKWHLYISLIKSTLRIIGCILAIAFTSWYILTIGLFVAELLGVLEEVNDQR